MKRKLLLQDKNAVSLMVGYVLLIVIVIGLSVAVFAYLKLYLPSETPSCPADIAVSITALCRPGNVEVTFTNRGLFSIDGALVRVGDFDRLRKDLLNENAFLFTDGLSSSKLEPGEERTEDYTYIWDIEGNRQLEVEPVLFIEGEVVLCERAIVDRPIRCNNPPPASSP